MILYLLILVPILCGITIYLIQFRLYRPIAFLVQCILFAMTVYLFVKIDIVHERALLHSLGGYNTAVAINLVADNISALFLILTTFLFLCTMLYAYQKPYFDHKFLCLFMVLEGLIIGTFLAQDLFTLYALIEVSTIVVSILIMYKKDASAIYDGMVYLFTNMIAMTFYLIGVGYVYKIFGTLDILQLKEMVGLVNQPRTLILPYVFIMTAVGLKSAVMPLFSWLPHAHGAHSAPYIVSAVLSGLYVKGSLYIFIRIQSIFGNVLDTHTLFVALGFFTAFAAIFLALCQKDLKLMLAYSTISQIGLIIVGLSLEADYSYYGSVYHIINHALFKSALFLTAGIIIDHYGTRDIDDIKGVFRTMPFVGTVMCIAILGITGAPLFNGSISKYLIQKGTSDSALLEYGLVLINIGTIAYFLRLVKMLIGPSRSKKRIPAPQKTVVGTLGLLCFLGGIFGHYLVGVYFELDIKWGVIDYLEKLLIYLGSIAIGLLFYKFIYTRYKIFHTLREVELTFNELAMSIVTFFAGLLGYMMMTV